MGKESVEEFMSALIVKARAGCKTSFGQLVEKVHPTLHRIARKILFGEVQRIVGASDVVNDALLNAFQQIDGFNGKTVGEFQTWLERIAQNQAHTANQHWTRLKRDTRLDRPIVSPAGNAAELAAPKPKSSHSSSIHRLHLALERLPENQRRALQMQLLDGATIAEISQNLQCTKAAVGGLLKRAKATVREHLTQRHQEEA